VQAALGVSERKAFASTARGQRTDLSRPIIWGVAALIATAMMVLALRAKPYHAATPAGTALGGMALLFFVAAAALGARRRMARWPKEAPHPDRTGSEGTSQLGPLYVWARAHVAIGTLALLAVGLHSRMTLGGFITSMLVFLLALQTLTGFAGVWFYRWWPRRVTKLERASQVEEDVLEEREKILARRTELVLAQSDPAHRATAAAAINAAGSSLACLSMRYDPPATEANVLASLAGVFPRDPVLAATFVTLAKDAVRLSEIEAIRLLYKIRRNWLALHVGITAMLMTLVVVHVFSVASFYVRL
jgi:hypothetical protein